MRSRRAVLELLLAGGAAVACVFSWLAASSEVVVAPVLEGEPATASVVYYPPLLTLSLLLATAAGVLAVLGVSRLRRGASPAKYHSGSLPAPNPQP
ncbi:Uncharacterised protein [Mycolicibacterium vanbaalenii]|uniref:Transmembrane protein n=1 Tax=Mycolicibacterium vanbaalenii TaxID=110539 RepID=A0A5S9PZV8_MYCVN|nr:hypothetical protein [Mycolicibacterium vanbaalenii]CAA0110009.1 Uncharacterised protein [Mycolicibacterium vanbaalenii]